MFFSTSATREAVGDSSSDRRVRVAFRNKESLCVCVCVCVCVLISAGLCTHLCRLGSGFCLPGVTIVQAESEVSTERALVY